MTKNFFVQKNNILNRWWLVGLVILIGTVITVPLFLKEKKTSWSVFQATFNQRAIIQAQSVAEEIDRSLSELDGLRRFVETQVFVEREEFNQYVAPLLKELPLREVIWAPRISREELRQFEKRVRAEGVTGFRVYEKDGNDTTIPVSNRADYFPVYYEEPLQKNESRSGFDLAASQILKTAIDLCRDTGQSMALSVLGQDLIGQQNVNFYVLLPVYDRNALKDTVEQRRANFKGIIVSAYLVDEFIGALYDRLPREGLSCMVEDLDSSLPMRVLYQHELKGSRVVWSEPVLKYELILQVANRKWLLTIVPSQAYIDENLSEAYWWILPIGFMLTLLVAVLLHTVIRARVRAEELVEDRTAELNKQKDALQKSQEELRLILDSTAGGIYGIDLEGRCKFCNQACLRILGYTDFRDLIGKNMHEKIHHSHKDGAPYRVEQCRIFQAFREGKGTHVDDEDFWKADGTSFPVEYWSYPQIVQGHVIGAVVAFNDITERKQSEQLLRTERQRLENVILGTRAGMWEWNVQTGETIFNEIWANLLGYSLEELAPVSIKTWEKLTHPDDLQRTNELLEKHFSGELPYYDTEFRMRHKDGHWVWIYDRGQVISKTPDNKPLWMFGFHIDISHRKQVEIEVAKQAALITHLLDSIPDIIFFKDLQGVYMGCNPYFVQFVGRPREEVIGKTDYDLFDKEVADQFRENDKKMLEQRKGRHNEEWVTYPDGRKVLLDTLKSPYWGPDGQLIGLVGISRDITERKKAEQAIADAAKIKTDFTDMVSHELRTPLSIIKEGVAVVLEKLAGDINAEQSAYLKIAQDNVERLGRLITAVLDFEKFEYGKMVFTMEEYGINEVIEEVQNEIQLLLAKKGLFLKLHLTKDLPVVKLDRDKIIQVLLNVLNNALKFTQTGGVSITTHEGIGNIQVAITDTGRGIKAEDMSKLFQAFTQLERTSGGTGLGLAICKKIIEAHKGKMWAESEFGKGSTFYFTLPISDTGHLNPYSE